MLVIRLYYQAFQKTKNGTRDLAKVTCRLKDHSRFLMLVSYPRELYHETEIEREKWLRRIRHIAS